MISVMIVTHNRGHLIAGAINSVLRQSFDDLELIIVDDASDDDTEAIVRGFSDPRIRYQKIVKANSIARVRNIALSLAKGKYLTVLDSDDIWCDDDKLLKQFNFLEANPDYVLIGGAAKIIDSSGKELRIEMKPLTDLDIRRDFLVKNPFFHSSVMYRAGLGVYNEAIKFGEDWDLWLRLGKVGKLANLDEVLVKYRVHDDNEATKHPKGAIFDVLAVIKNHRQAYGGGRFVILKKIWRKLQEFK